MNLDTCSSDRGILFSIVFAKTLQRRIFLTEVAHVIVCTVDSSISFICPV